MTMLQRILLFVIANFLSLQAAEKPNIVIILSDDLGYGTVGCYGADPALIRTPNIDRLAKEGRRFTDANTTSSVCSPTRYSMVTGRYCWRTSLQSEVLGTLSPLHIETTRLTIASMLKQQGYNTAAVGKWHLGYGTAERCDYSKELKPGPLEIGFDYHFSVPSNHGDIAGVYIEDHWVYGLNKESPTDPSPPYVTLKEGKTGGGSKTIPLNAPKRIDEAVMPLLTDKATEWIEKQSSDKPFFLYYTPVAVHNPVTPSPATAGSSKAGSFGDWVHELDESVGRVIAALEKKGVLDNTLILFSSDNGGVNTERDSPQSTAQKAGLKPVGPFKGGKHNVWEGGFRVPYLVRWPGHVPAGSVCAETISIVDTLATIAGITGYPLPKAGEAAEDSYDVSRAWLGQKYEGSIRPDLIVHSADGNFAIRKGPWKWIEGVPADDVKATAKRAHAAEFRRMLYDLNADIAETSEVSAQHPEIVRELEGLLVRYRDGGYSRELPPVVVKPKIEIAKLPELAGEKLLSARLDSAPQKPWSQIGNWKLSEGAFWGKSKIKDKPADLSAPLAITNGTLQLDFNFRDADRISVRIHTSEPKGSFRIVIGGGKIDIAKNAEPGESADKTVQLAREKLKIKSDAWHTLRLTFKGDELIAQVAGSTVKAKHPIIAQPKGAFHLLVFEGELGLRNVEVVK